MDENGIAHYTIKRDEHRVLPPAEANARPDGPELSVPQEMEADPHLHEGIPGLPQQAEPPDAFPVPGPQDQQEESQLSKLEDQINQERERIKSLITDGPPNESDIVTSPLLREISERLRRLQLDIEEQRGEPSQ